MTIYDNSLKKTEVEFEHVLVLSGSRVSFTCQLWVTGVCDFLGRKLFYLLKKTLRCLRGFSEPGESFCSPFASK